MLTHMKKALHSGSCSQRLWFSLKKTAWPSVQHLAEKREIWSEKIGELSRKIYREVFHAKEGFSLNYSGNLPGLESRFWQSSEREMEQRRMLVGPHLDDFSFLFGEHQLKQVGSSGQIRSGVLSVMMAVMVLMRERNGSWPLWLMDDFDSELDTQRLGNVLHWVGDKGQVFLTSAADYAKIKVLWKELGLNENAIATFHCQDGSIRH
jgi:DNA replication and repair protein RecF